MAAATFFRAHNQGTTRRTQRTTRRRKDGSFQFSVYKHPSVVEALNVLFSGKCAYCESFYEKTQKMDVEHYRPKGAYYDERGQICYPGYYWLAADWDTALEAAPREKLRRRTTSQ